MASAKITFKAKPNRDKTISVQLQIIHKRVVYPKVIARVPVADWDGARLQVRHRNVNSVVINQTIADRLKEAKDYLLECQKRKINPDPYGFLHGARTGADLVSHLNARLATFDNERTRSKYRTCIARITEANLNISITDITPDWIDKFTRVLKAAGNNANTRQKYVSVVGSIFRAARIKGLITVNPFEGRPKNATPSTKAKLTPDEWQRIKSARFEGNMEAVRKLFVFAVLARGMRAFDVLTLEWGCINGNRLIYQAQKAGKNADGKWFDIEMDEDMWGCIGESGARGYVFPFVDLPRSLYTTDRHTYVEHVDSKLTVINRTLKTIAAAVGISKNLTMHVARHTFAFLMDHGNVPLGTIQQLLGHGDITTTKIYVESIRKADDLDKVVRGKL